ncbi:MAG TPA: glycosyltransferase, partial [Candidatus Omnitrophota bacterium]|nr:glycosyltransferase [Candidatus Omnitrophota bacterium]
TKHDSHEMDLKLGIREKLFTVLVTSGGAGIGDTQAIVKGILSLKKPVQVLVVCGTNKALFMALSGMAQENRLLKVFGFVSNMDELMEASDVVVGKAGGLTVTESFVKGKPVILFRSVPGQESRNADFVARNEVGFTTDSIKEVVSIVSRLHDEPDQIQALRDKVRRIARPNASFDIVKVVEEERS